MGLLEQEIKELRDLRERFRKGKIDAQAVNCEIAIYSQIEKRAKLILQAHLGCSRKDNGTLKKLIKLNYMGDGQAIDTGEDVEMEKIKCPLKEGIIITRAECLDISGSKENVDECKGCEAGKTTKQLLLRD